MKSKKCVGVEMFYNEQPPTQVHVRNTMALIDRLHELEQTLSPLNSNNAGQEEWWADIKEHVQEIVPKLQQRPVLSSDDSGLCEKLLSVGLSEGPGDLSSALSIVQDTVNHFGLQTGKSGHMAYIPGNLNFLSAVGNFIASAANPYCGVNQVSPGATAFHKFLIQWLASIVGYPESSGGDLTSGGSIANLTAVVTARESHNIRPADIEKSVVYYSTQSHHSNAKAIHIAGMGGCQHRIIPVDDTLKIDTAVLTTTIAEDAAKGLKPWLIIGNAGDTDTGSVDDLHALADLAEEYSCWFHIDAAYGGGFALCELGRTILDGIERSDSVSIDPHKSMFVTFGCGALIVKDKNAVRDALNFSGSYMREVNLDSSPSSMSPELTRPFRALQLWLPMVVMGVAPYRAAVEEKMLLARYAHQRVSQFSHFWVGPEPMLSTLVFRFQSGNQEHDDRINDHIAKTISLEGHFYASTTQLDGVVTLRISILTLGTHRDTIDGYLDRVQSVASKASGLVI
jgi:aromatic-L-amino-acid decarboxylase